jgi:hypothetical protein
MVTEISSTTVHSRQAWAKVASTARQRAEKVPENQSYVRLVEGHVLITQIVTELGTIQGAQGTGRKITLVVRGPADKKVERQWEGPHFYPAEWDVDDLWWTYRDVSFRGGNLRSWAAALAAANIGMFRRLWRVQRLVCIPKAGFNDDKGNPAEFRLMWASVIPKILEKQEHQILGRLTALATKHHHLVYYEDNIKWTPEYNPLLTTAHLKEDGRDIWKLELAARAKQQGNIPTSPEEDQQLLHGMWYSYGWIVAEPPYHMEMNWGRKARGTMGYVPMPPKEILDTLGAPRAGYTRDEAAIQLTAVGVAAEMFRTCEGDNA